MATSSDQIQAEIARTRARMASHIDQVGLPYGRPQPRNAVRPGRSSLAGSSTLDGGGLIDQVRQRPLLALGIGLIAGSLLQDYLSDEPDRGGAVQTGSRPTYPAYGVPSYGQTEGAMRQGIGEAAQSVGDAAQSVGQTVADTAQSAVGTARDAASAVVDTTVDVAQRAGSTVSDVAYQTMDTAADVTEEVTERVGDLASTVSDFVSEQPLIAVGLSLVAGSLLQQYLRGSRGSAQGAYSPYASAYPSYPSYPSEYSAYGGAWENVGATQTATRSVTDAAHSTARAVSDAAHQAVDTTRDAASTVADTAVDVAQRAGDAVSDAASQVVDTAGSTVGYVTETVGDLWPAASRQVQERPLTMIALATGAGMLLQPTLRPHVQAITADVQEFWNSLAGSVGDITNLPEPPEVQRIRGALVPATVERTRRLLNHEVRDYLETSLEGMIGQPSLRAGAVAAITDKAEAFVDSKLPNLLNGLSGTTGLLLLGLTGAVLEARTQAQQGQGGTIANVRSQLSQSLVQNAQEQLSRYFPEFREELQSQEEQQQAGQQDGSEQCPNCGSQVAPRSRFCPNCGKAMTEGAS